MPNDVVVERFPVDASDRIVTSFIPQERLVDDPSRVVDREWIVTNGIGGYASGTIAGVLTRRYHGLLVAALDPPLRSNQLFAVSLFHSPLPSDRQRAVVDACAGDLLTPLGLCTLGPDGTGYRGRFGGRPIERDGAYHRGTVWPWLIGPFADAHLRVYEGPDAIERMMMPFIAHLDEYGMGSIAECAEGDLPHDPRATIAQAWSVAEVLRVLRR